MKHNEIDMKLVESVISAEKAYYGEFFKILSEKPGDVIFPELHYLGDGKIYKLYQPHMLPRTVWDEVLDAAEAAGYEVDRHNRTIYAKGEPYELTEAERREIDAWLEDPASWLGDYETEIDCALAKTSVADHDFD